MQNDTQDTNLKECMALKKKDIKFGFNVYSLYNQIHIYIKGNVISLQARCSPEGG